MRKLIAAIMVAGATLVAGPVLAADFPEYPPIIEIPDVDYGVEGSFYLRGSAAGNVLWSRNQRYFCPPTPGGGCGVAGSVVTEPLAENGYGYSVGAGFGYEAGGGLRADVTVDYLQNSGLASIRGQELTLRTALALANVYYDFGFSGYGSAQGGPGAYVGAGFGAAYNFLESRGPWTGYDRDGGAYSAAGALMAGVTYDMGAVVADLGYRMVYMPQLSNGSNAQGTVQGPYFVNDNFIHEVRGTVRYRF